MPPNKEWIKFTNINRLSEKYNSGIREFLDYAFEKTCEVSEIRCPCVKCNNSNSGTREFVHTHLIKNGIMENYTFWYHHGERRCVLDSDEEESDEVDCDDGVNAILNDLYPGIQMNEEEPNGEAKKFYKLLEELDRAVYPGCKTSKLDALVKLLYIKSVGRWSNKSFDMLLQVLKEILPDGSTLPESYYDAKRIIKDVGLSYEKIDACAKDCMLYWKGDENLDKCKICGLSRWKDDVRNGEAKVRRNRKKILVKTMRYFPLKPRLQRLFMSKKTASLMRWHKDDRVDDGIMRHPADSPAWKTFDEVYKEYAFDPRNVRLGLATDGFQPFNNSKTSYSIWPVILIPYNLPPWMCMKEPNFILSTLIPGPQGLGDAIDVYLQPLVEELKELWEVGVETFDASTSQNFTLHANLLWTINDFPAYANLSGWSTKGKMACPWCNKKTCSLRLANCQKECYLGHRQYLDSEHKWRKDAKNFDGTQDFREPPKQLSGSDVLVEVADLEGIVLSKDISKKTKISHKNRGDNWNKKSILFQLSYWGIVLVRHNFDVMHIEKNICDNIVGTIMNVAEKTKDTAKSRQDLKAMNIRPDLHLIRRGDKDEMPVACYTLSQVEKHSFFSFFKQLKVPDGFSSNISQCVNMKELKISGLKSHDCHVLLQHLIPLAICGLLRKKVCEPLVELSLFFTSLTAKALRKEELEQIRKQIPITLCKLEQIFVPSFFDVMVHLPIHLADEAILSGPVQYRWMYPIERYLHDLKQLIRNMARPEGSIAEGYIAKECMTLCSRYLNGIETKFNRLERNDNGGSDNSDGGIVVFSQHGRGLGSAKPRNLVNNEWEEAHAYVINNCDEAIPFLEEYSQIPESSHPQQSFNDWFRNRVANMYESDKERNVQDLLSLSRGPSQYVTNFDGYIVNGYRFRIEDCDNHRRTQNCGVFVSSDIGNEGGPVEYYGILTEILELQYLNGKRVVLFRCKWFDVHDNVKGSKVDAFGFTCINSQRYLKTNEPFILASQASQVFFALDNTNKDWRVVKTQ